MNVKPAGSSDGAKCKASSFEDARKNRRGGGDPEIRVLAKEFAEEEAEHVAELDLAWAWRVSTKREVCG